MRSPSQLADLTASLIDAEPNEKQMLLETASLEERLRTLLSMLAHRIEVLRLSQEIGEELSAMDRPWRGWRTSAGPFSRRAGGSSCSFRPSRLSTARSTSTSAITGDTRRKRSRRS